MGRTQVRRLRAYIARTVFYFFERKNESFRQYDLKGIGPLCASAFVIIQMLLIILLIRNGALDVLVALCLSAGLLLFAGATNASSSAAPINVQESLPVMRQGALYSEISVPARASDRETGMQIRREFAVPATDIDEQSQTWADLMARISHDIRTPLNAVIGFSDLMSREIFGPLGHPRYLDYVVHVRESGERLLKAAEDTLALSSMLASHPVKEGGQSTALAHLALDAWTAVEPHANRHQITLDTSRLAQLDVSGDRRALRQVLTNLLIDAAHRAEAGSTVEIGAQAENDIVRLVIGVRHPLARGAAVQPSLPECIARTLLEHMGTSLVTRDRPQQGGWEATTVLDLAAQPDFFRIARTDAGTQTARAAHC